MLSTRRSDHEVHDADNGGARAFSHGREWGDQSADFGISVTVRASEIGRDGINDQAARVDLLDGAF